MQSTYIVLSKPVFILGMIMVVLPSCLGVKHSFFNLILTAKAFIWIARVSFCTYLVHLMIIDKFIVGRFYDVYYNITDTWVLYLSWLVMSLFFGFLLTVTVELPFANLLKLAFEKQAKKQNLEKSVKEESKPRLD